MFPSQLFAYCPRCGQQRDASAPRQPFECAGCGLHCYFNAALAVAGFLRGPDGKVLFIRRARDPARGKLAVPGGFVEIGETAEEALRRETLEEVNLEIGPLEFLCSAPNEYHYRDVTYPVLDLAFIARVDSAHHIAALDGVESYVWLNPAAVDPAEIAFPSIRRALEQYLQRTAAPPAR